MKEAMLVRAEIQQIALAHRRRYGYRWITAELRRRGLLVNHKPVARLMRKDNLLAIQPRAFMPILPKKQFGHRGWYAIASPVTLCSGAGHFPFSRRNLGRSLTEIILIRSRTDRIPTILWISVTARWRIPFPAMSSLAS